MSFAKSHDDVDIKQFKVVAENPYIYKNYEEIFFNLKMKYNGVLIGVSKIKKTGERELIKNPAFDLKIELGDYLIIILNGEAHQHVSKIFNVEEGIIQ
jgi:voltage-gated potassium channel